MPVDYYYKDVLQVRESHEADTKCVRLPQNFGHIFRGGGSRRMEG